MPIAEEVVRETEENIRFIQYLSKAAKRSLPGSLLRDAKREEDRVSTISPDILNKPINM